MGSYDQTIGKWRFFSESDDTERTYSLSGVLLVGVLCECSQVIHPDVLTITLA